MWLILRKIPEMEAFVPPGAAALWCKCHHREELSPWAGKHTAHALSDVAVTSCVLAETSASFTSCEMCAEWSSRQGQGCQLWPRQCRSPGSEILIRNSAVILQLISFPGVFNHFFPTNNLCYIWKWCFSLLTASEYEKAGEGVASWQGSFLIWKYGLGSHFSRYVMVALWQVRKWWL